MPTVIHVGDSPAGAGGISSVVRSHLSRQLPGLAIRAVPTHDPNATSFANRIRVFGTALQSVMRLDQRRHSYILHVHMSQKTSILREGAFVLLAKARRIPCIVTLHGSRALQTSRAAHYLYKSVLRQAAVVHGFAEKYRVHFGVAPYRWAQIPNDVEVGDALPFNERPLTVTYLGEVGERKGIDRLIAAWPSVAARHPRWNLKVAGPVRGPSEIRDRLAAMEQTEVMGVLSPTEAAELLASTRLLVQPSRAEAFPMSVCEAMAAGCAVLGTDVGGLGDLLRASGQGILTGEVNDLIRHLDSKLSDPDLLQVGMRGHDYARNHLDRRVVNAQWGAIYRDLVVSHGPQIGGSK